MRILPAVTAFLGLAVVGPGSVAPPLSFPHSRSPRDATMIALPSGRSQIGDDAAPPAERPAFQAEVSAFLLDRTPVTVAQFAAFVRETGFVTDADRAGGGQVLNRADGGWMPLRGADWRRPEGVEAGRAQGDRPVTQVSWRDADAFCKAYGLRLPTEVEWERAARLGQTRDGHVFVANDPRALEQRSDANLWQGLYPLVDEGADGWRTTSPVGFYGAAPSGFTDMAGNVWEWTASWYAPYGSRNPAKEERVQRGGSYLCDASFCQGFRVTARGHSTPDTALVHVGFRCAADGARPPTGAGALFTPPNAPQRRADAPSPPKTGGRPA